MDGLTRGRLSLALAVLLAGALAFTGLQLTGGGADDGQASSSLPTPPTLTIDAQSMLSLDGQADDGLNRFVVALADGSQQVDGVTSDGQVVTLESDGDSDFVYEGRDEDRFAESDEISEADMALLEELNGGQGASASASQIAWSGDPDDLVNVDGIESVTEAGPGFAAIATSLSSSQISLLEGLGEVAEDDLRTYAQADYYSFQWGHENLEQPGRDVRFEDANAVADGTGTVVAVIDSGVDLDHPDLAGSWWTNPGETCGDGVDNDGNGYVDDCNGWDFANDDASVDDEGADNNHGTHVAGIIAASHDAAGIVGLAPGARVMPLKIFHNGASASSRLAAAITYAVDNGADVINLSLGGDAGTPAEEAALARASAAGLTVVVASGNEGRSTDWMPTYPAAYEFDGLIAVGSSDADDRRSSFSNHGARSVDLYAPGGNILSTVPDGLAYMSGTSMAAPYVSGAAALVAQQGLRGDAAKTVLMTTAEPVQHLEGSSVTGARLDAAAAVGVPRGGDGDPEIIFTSFQDLAHDVEDEAAVWVTAQMEDLTADDLVVRGTLGVIDEGQIFVVVDEQLTVQDRLVTTDGAGQFLLTDQAGLSGAQRQQITTGLELPVGLQLPHGAFVLAIELLDAANPDAGPVSTPGLVYFGVAQGDGAADPVITDGIFEDPEAPAEAPTTAVPSTPTPGDDEEAGAGDAPGVVPAPDGSGDPVPGDGTVVGDPLTGGGTVVGDVLDGDGDVAGGTPSVPGTGVSAGDGTGSVETPADDSGLVTCLTDAVDGATGGVNLGEGRGNGNGPGNSNGNGPGNGNGRGVGLTDGVGIGNDGRDAGSPGRGNGRGNGLGNGDDARDDVEDAVECVTTTPSPVDGGTTVTPGTGEDDGADGTAGDVTDVVDGVTGVVTGALTGIVNPAQGRPDLASASVTIDQGIPEGAFIRFDDSNASITSRISGNRVIVTPPAHAPGLVDVHVVHDGVTLTLPDAFTYLEVDGSIPIPDDVTDPVEDGSDATAPGADGDVTPPATGDDGDGATGGAPGAVPAPDVETGDDDVDDEVVEIPGAVPAPAPDAGDEDDDRDPWQLRGMWIDDMPADSPLAGLTPRQVGGEQCRQEVCASRTA